jgi:hypothetical protein
MAGDIHETTGRSGDPVRLDAFQNIKNIHWPKKGKLATVVTTFLHEYGYNPWGGDEQFLLFNSEAVHPWEIMPWPFDAPKPHAVGAGLEYIQPVPGGTANLGIRMPKNWLTLTNGALRPNGASGYSGKFCGVMFFGTTGYQLTSMVQFINFASLGHDSHGEFEFAIQHRFGRADENSWIFKIQIATWDGTTDWRYAGYDIGLESITPGRPVKDQYHYAKGTEGGPPDNFYVKIDADTLKLNVTHTTGSV